jgi:hypothetical protein
MQIIGPYSNGTARPGERIDLMVNQAEALWILDEHPEWLGPVAIYPATDTGLFITPERLEALVEHVLRAL